MLSHQNIANMFFSFRNTHDTYNDINAQKLNDTKAPFFGTTSAILVRGPMGSSLNRSGHTSTQPGSDRALGTHSLLSPETWDLSPSRSFVTPTMNFQC